MVIVNWISLCPLKGEMLNEQTQVLSHLLSKSDRNIGLVLMPTFTYTKGSLWSNEQAIFKLIKTRGLNADHHFVLQIAERVDSRDERPLVYNCRIIVNNGVSWKDSIWRDADVVRKNRTAEAKQRLTKEMHIVEDLDPSALPSSCDSAAVTIHEAKKTSKTLKNQGAMKS